MAPAALTVFTALLLLFIYFDVLLINLFIESLTSGTLKSQLIAFTTFFLPML